MTVTGSVQHMLDWVSECRRLCACGICVVGMDVHHRTWRTLHVMLPNLCMIAGHEPCWDSGQAHHDEIHTFSYQRPFLKALHVHAAVLIILGGMSMTHTVCSIAAIIN